MGNFSTLINFNPHPPHWVNKQIIRKPIIYPSPTASHRKPNQSQTTVQNIEPRRGAQIEEYVSDPIWLVEKTPHYEIYSNRLQIMTTYCVPNVPRKYYQQSRDRSQPDEAVRLSDAIAGIVYHASESDLVPFKPELNSSIKEKSKRLIKYLQRKKSYNYFIDRYGRIFRIVQEDHTAFHAGRSVWADDNAIYIDLNHSFLGICFEGRGFEETGGTAASDESNSNRRVPRIRPTGRSSINDAQLRSGKELTDWLRVKYRIPQSNCVPHALVSVNPAKKLIGYHLDLSRGFPFAKFSLSNKYESPLPSMVEFGFSYDSYFSAIFSGKIWPGIYRSEEILRKRAWDARLSPAGYRRLLNAKFELCAGLQKLARQKREVIGIARN
jgi:hypothetical protein